MKIIPALFQTSLNVSIIMNEVILCRGCYVHPGLHASIDLTF